MKHIKCLSLSADKFVSFKDYQENFDVFEIRLDKNFTDSIADSLCEHFITIRRQGKDIIAACKRIGAGGDYKNSEEERIALLKWAIVNGANIVDIETDSGTEARSLLEMPEIKIIRSYHNYHSVPIDIQSIAREMLRMNCWLFKIVCKVNEYKDNLILLRLNQFFRNYDKPSTCFGLGEKALYSRVFVKTFGGVLSYISLKGNETAPGQITIDLLKLLDIDAIDDSTECYGITGFPLHHSRSFLIHNLAMRLNRINAVFLDFPTTDINEFVEFIVSAPLKGLAITYPYKSHEWFEKIAQIDPKIQSYGSGNTIYFSDNKYILTDTDREGFIEFFEKDVKLDAGKALIIGSGNTAIKIADYLLQCRWKVNLASRFPHNKKFGFRFPELLVSYTELKNPVYTLLINATPINTYTSDNWCNILYNKPRENIVVLDLNYGEAAAPFLQCGLFNNCRVYDGHQMLLNQAALQFKIWTGLQISSEKMVKIKQLAFSGYDF